jgi:hypothetical protein
MNPLATVAAFGGVLYALARASSSSSSSSVEVTSLSDRVKRVTVEGRAYLVFRLGSGDYNVMRVDNPAVRITFGQDGAAPTEAGDAITLAQLKADAQRFPSGLFT